MIHFKVAEETAGPVETVLEVNLASSNIIYRAPSNTITATLKEKVSGNPVAGQPIDFYLEGTYLTTKTTDEEGVATYEYDTSSLGVGDYTVAAKFAGTGNYLSSSNSSTQCVTYKFKGFLPPVLVQDPVTLGLGVGLFQGKVIPVKIKIADYYDDPVTTAQPRVYWAKTSAPTIDTPAVEIQPTTPDDSNIMRYDPSEKHYILNWNISNIKNGDYNIRVGLDEGSCATGHWVPVRIGKATK